MNEIAPGIEMHDLALFLREEKALVIADLHLGYEENLHKQGFLVPWFQFEKIKSRLEKIIAETKPEKIIINGDLKHEFGRIPQQEWQEVLKMIDFLSKNCNELILIKGNHDNILGPIAEKRELKIENGLSFGDTYLCHGHKIPENLKFQAAKTIIIAHEHPAIGISDNIVTEKFKCYLKGKWKRKTLIVQPSFCLVTEGSDVLQEKPLSPFLDQPLGKFEAWVVADKILYFGKLKALAGY